MKVNRTRSLMLKLKLLKLILSGLIVTVIYLRFRWIEQYFRNRHISSNLITALSPQSPFQASYSFQPIFLQSLLQPSTLPVHHMFLNFLIDNLLFMFIGNKLLRTSLRHFSFLILKYLYSFKWGLDL